MAQGEVHHSSPKLLAMFGKIGSGKIQHSLIWNENDHSENMPSLLEKVGSKRSELIPSSGVQCEGAVVALLTSRAEGKGHR